MTRHYVNYTDADIIRYAAEVKSMAALLKKLGLKSAGGNYSNMKRKLQSLNLECKHWKGQGWNKGEQLKDWSDYSRNSTIKPHLIRDRGHKCEGCQNTQWMKEPIPIELHHTDGDRTNNSEENLQLLCPNCHALTDTWRGRKYHDSDSNRD